jgi:hypothetical protein
MLTKEISKVENKVKELRKRGYTTENTNDCTLDNEAILFIKSQAKLSTLKSTQAKFDKFIEEIRRNYAEQTFNEIMEILNGQSN